jgi:chromosome segregation ATPase
MDRMDVAMSKLSVQQNIVFSRLEDVEDDMNVCKKDIDVVKSQLASLERDIHMLEASMGLAHNQLEDLGDRVDGFIESIQKVSSISDTNNQSLGLEIQRVQRETRSHLKGFFQKFEKVNDIIDKKIIRQDEEMDRVVGLVRQKIDTKMGEFSSDLMEAVEIEENFRKDLETKVPGLEERLEHTLTHVANLAALLLSVQSRVTEVEDAVMADAEEDGDGEVLSSSSSDLDPVENMVAIPIPGPSVIHTLVEIPEEFIPPILQLSSSVPLTPSPLYVQAPEEDPSHNGVPEYWADPEVSNDWVDSPFSS